MTQGPGAVTGSSAHLVHHLEEVMGTIVVIDVYATDRCRRTGGTGDQRAARRGGSHLAPGR